MWLSRSLALSTTYADIARECGVSRATVSLVLRNPDHPEFSAQTRQRVLEIARRLNYTPNRVAASLRGGQTRTIGFVAAYNEGELMIQFTHKPDRDLEQTAVRAAIEHRVDGLIWRPSQPAAAYRELLPQLRRLKSVVLIERRLRALPRADHVFCDVRPGMRRSIEHLKERGYQRFVYLVKEPIHVTKRYRVRLFRRLVGSASHVIQYPRDGATQREFMRERLRPLMDRDSRLGIISDLDWGVIPVIEACRDLGARIPEDVGVIGINDSMIGGSFRIGEVTCPTFTALRRPVGDLARVAVSQLVARINGNRTGLGRAYSLDTTLIERQSTASPLGSGDLMGLPADLPQPATPAPVRRRRQGR